MSSSGVREPESELAREAFDADPATAPAPEAKPAPAPPRPRRSGGRLVMSLAAALLTLLITIALAIPPVAALVVAGWALFLALSAIWGLAPLIGDGRALTSSQTPAYLHALDAGGRIGFVAIGYLALIFSLITLMAGLLGRRWGRLFVAPGALFVVTALALLGLAVILVAPLMAGLPLSTSWVVALGVYAMLDAVVVSGVMVDARLTRSPTATGQHRAAPSARTRARRAQRGDSVEPLDARPAW